MPELPEAEVAAVQLRRRILGSIVQHCWVGRSDIIREGGDTMSWYGGSRVESVERRGKTVVIAFSRDGDKRFLAAELGMTKKAVRQAKYRILKRLREELEFQLGEPE